MVAIQKHSKHSSQESIWWTPPVPSWKPLKKTLNSSLRIACIVSDRLYQGLRFEGQVMLVTPQNWKKILTYGKPDFLLIESTENTATEHWSNGQNPSSSEWKQLLEIVSWGRQLSIPTVYWLTEDRVYHDRYKNFARYFDFVFCADPQEVELLQTEGIEAETLLPCIQPALYNPFRLYEYYDSLNLNILFDGWADVERIGEALGILQEVKPYGLSIIESQNQVSSGNLESLAEYKDCILGYVTKQDRILALKYAKAYITFEQTLSSRTNQQWMALEAAATRLPVVHYGKLSDGDVRKGVVIECPDRMEFLVEFVRFREDNLYRERVGHLGWRYVFQNHTFAHRIQKISQTIGVEHDWEEYPKASLITPTYRRKLLPQCLETFEGQTYPNKEYILVFNGQDMPSHKELGIDETRNDICIANVPRELFAGACLNQGYIIASGKYCFRVDDDDDYGPNYILDMILHSRSIDSDLFGKPPAPVYFENSSDLYAKRHIKPLSIVNSILFQNGKTWIGGNTLSIKRELITDFYYCNHLFGSADTSFLLHLKENSDLTCTLMDSFNIAAQRRNELSSHTWKLGYKSIIENRTKIGEFCNVFI